jgi:hypothetical protein
MQVDIAGVDDGLGQVELGLVEADLLAETSPFLDDSEVASFTASCARTLAFNHRKR